jgi:hypothetical protein
MLVTYGPGLPTWALQQVGGFLRISAERPKISERGLRSRCLPIAPATSTCLIGVKLGPWAFRRPPAAPSSLPVVLRPPGDRGGRSFLQYREARRRQSMRRVEAPHKRFKSGRSMVSDRLMQM